MAFGISGAALSSKIMEYRILLLIVAFALLAVAFWFAYKPRGKTDNEQSKDSSKKSTGINFLQLNRILLWIVAALTIAFAFMPYYHQIFHRQKIPKEYSL